MYARNVTSWQLKAIADELHFEAQCEQDGNRVRFTLRNHRDRLYDFTYWVVSRNLWGKDRTFRKKVCYHGHWEFFERLFEEYPDAVVHTSYYGKVCYTASDWKQTARDLGSEVLRPIDGLMLRDKCECESEGWDE